MAVCLYYVCAVSMLLRVAVCACLFIGGAGWLSLCVCCGGTTLPAYSPQCWLILSIYVSMLLCAVLIGCGGVVVVVGGRW